LEYSKGCLAESWDVPDPLTYVFTIRKGIHWHNKPPMNVREFVAKDVEYTFHRLLGLGSGYDEPDPFVNTIDWDGVIGVEATEKYKVVFTLSEPRPLMLDHLVGIANSDLIVPPEVIEMYGDMEDWKNACGTGPFMLVDYVPANSLTLDRNPSYWGYDELHPENRLPYFDQVRMLIIPDNSTRLAAIRTGKIDVLTEVPSLTWEQKETLEQSNPELKWGRHLDMGRGLQCRNDREPFDDVRVRKALRITRRRQRHFWLRPVTPVVSRPI